jgi:ABC-type nitrate/sulfonate/bicarbonate transport system substrate-binding protein
MGYAPRVRRAFFALFFFFFAARADAMETVRVLVPDRDNLQYMSFWIAKDGGFFEKEGLTVEIVAPPGPQQTSAFFSKREAEIAVLPPPVYLQLIAEKEPVVLVANLLANDPIDLVVRREVLEARHLTRDMPLKDRLVGLRGIKLGVAPHPPARLRALYASVGLDADKDLELVILHGKEQNAAFTEKKVDALYAHTPYLERAIVQDGAVVLVEQTAGEALANRQIHTLCMTGPLLERRRDLGAALVRAIARAEASIHDSQPTTVDTLTRAFPKRDRRELETIVKLYEPAIPKTPDVRAEDLPPALALFPAGMPKPDLAGIDLAKHVAPGLANVDDGVRRRWIMIGSVAAVLMLAAVVAVLRARRSAR